MNTLSPAAPVSEAARESARAYARLITFVEDYIAAAVSAR